MSHQEASREYNVRDADRDHEGSNCRSDFPSRKSEPHDKGQLNKSTFEERWVCEAAEIYTETQEYLDHLHSSEADDHE